MKILLTGATGYVGGRFLKKLEASGHAVRCLARRPEHLKAWADPSTEIFSGDLLDAASIARAMEGVEVAYYLVHSMGSERDFEEQERRSAENFAAEARKAKIRKIVYLGGLSHGTQLSPHLASRRQVGEILRASGIPVVEFQASIIIGSGSLSFEMIRSLVERLPMMLTPTWVHVQAQPIAIEDVIAYLYEAVEKPFDESRIFEIGGPDRLSYLDLMKEYGSQRNLKRLIIPVPVLSPWLSSLWLGLITPLYARVGRKLIESIRHETTVHDKSALEVFSVKPRPIREAIARALVHEDEEMALTRWSDALSLSGANLTAKGRLGNRLADARTVEVPATCDSAFQVIERMGGANGWYFANWLWRLRGFLDLLSGGIGMRRGRRNPNKLVVGDVVDWWRVEACQPGALLRLHAEMKLPGRAWLQYELSPSGAGCRITQTALFDPGGLAGLAYWYAVWPLHQIVFRGMLNAIALKCRA